MGRAAQVDRVRDDFIKRITAAEKLVAAVRPLAAIKGAGTGTSLHVENVGQIIELAFLGLCAQWETFIEDSMVRYLTGAKPSAGNAPHLRLGKCSDLAHAYQVLSGKPSYDSSSDFMSWTKPESVIERAKMFFKDGEPFSSAISTCRDELKRAIQLRNRIAHSSEKCVADFKAAANYYLAPKTVTQGYRVADLLGTPHTKNFTFLAAPSPGPTRDYFAAHADMFRLLAQRIVP
jgi:hypothetical protein